MYSLAHGRSLRISSVVFTLVALLALTLALLLGIQRAPAAHASGSPSVVQSTTVQDMSGSGTSLSQALASNVTSGDELVVLVGWAGGNDYQVSGVSDSQSTSFSQIASRVCDGFFGCAEIWAGALGASGADTVTVTLSENGCPCGSTWVQSTFTAVELSNQASGALHDGGSASNVENNSGGGLGNNQHVVNTSGLPQTSTDLYLGLYVDDGANATLTLPSGETRLGSKNDATVNMEHDQAMVAAGNNLEFDSNPRVKYDVSLAVAIAGA